MSRYAIIVGVALLSFPLCAQESDGPEATRASPAWMPPAPNPAIVAAPEPARVASPPVAERVSSTNDRGGRRWGVFSAGFTLFAVSYAADVGVTYGMGHSSPATSLIPIFGPIVQAGDKYQLADPKMAQGNATIGQMISDGNHAYQSAIYAGLAVDAVVQFAGIVTAIVGLSTHTHRAVSLVAQGGHGGVSVRF